MDAPVCGVPTHLQRAAEVWPQIRGSFLHEFTTQTHHWLYQYVFTSFKAISQALYDIHTTCRQISTSNRIQQVSEPKSEEENIESQNCTPALPGRADTPHAEGQEVQEGEEGAGDKTEEQESLD